MTLNLILQASGGAASFLPFLLIIVVFYFFMIRPQMKRQKQEKVFRDSIAKGAKVVTTGGMHGKVVEIDETSLVLEVQTGIRIRMEKSAISKELSVQYENKKED
jgi:preprotein translocase subunit YajC